MKGIEKVREKVEVNGQGNDKKKEARRKGKGQIKV